VFGGIVDFTHNETKWAAQQTSTRDLDFGRFVRRSIGVITEPLSICTEGSVTIVLTVFSQNKQTDVTENNTSPAIVGRYKI